jgi:uncharacterized membrane protein
MKLFQTISDWAADNFARPWFLMSHIVWWTIWLALPVEPFPYGLLTMILSLEAILLSGLILNATNRQGEEDREIIEKDLTLDGKSHTLLEQIWNKLHEGDYKL